MTFILKHSILSLLLFCFFNSGAQAFDHNHKLLDNVLKNYLSKASFVNYQLLKKHAQDRQHDLIKYIAALESISHDEFKSFSKHQQMAFLINAYNALTLKLIIDHYPVSSIKKIGGSFLGLGSPWGKEFFNLLGGKIKSLDPIEHDYLRPHYKDHRIHAAVNCASISCPVLRREAYIGKKLDQQLNEQMRIWFADKSRNRFDSKTNEIHLSKIFDWYEKDFVKWGGGIKTVLKRFTPENQHTMINKAEDFDYLEYNWKLNDIKNEAKPGNP